jgi:hypothetical protein
MRKGLGAAIPLALITCAALLIPASGASAPHQSDKIHWEAMLFSQIVPLDPADAEGVGPGQQGRHQDNCGAFGEAGRGAFDKDISCDDPIAPDNEIAVAVHPTNPNLVLGGSNDYQIQFQGATSILQVPSGFFLSQDGGDTWIDGELPLKGSLGGGDPVPGFDRKHNQMVFTSLSFVCGQFAPLCSRGNIHFASSPLDRLTGSADDQITWFGLTNGRVPREGFRLLAGEELLRVYRPKDGAVKVFCTQCGSSLFGGSWPEGDLVTVRFGALDDDPPGRPQFHSFIDSRAVWEELPDDGLPRYPDDAPS